MDAERPSLSLFVSGNRQSFEALIEWDKRPLGKLGLPLLAFKHYVTEGSPGATEPSGSANVTGLQGWLRRGGSAGGLQRARPGRPSVAHGRLSLSVFVCTFPAFLKRRAGRSAPFGGFRIDTLP